MIPYHHHRTANGAQNSKKVLKSKGFLQGKGGDDGIADQGNRTQRSHDRRRGKRVSQKIPALAWEVKKKKEGVCSNESATGGNRGGNAIVGGGAGDVPEKKKKGK